MQIQQFKMYIFCVKDLYTGKLEKLVNPICSFILFYIVKFAVDNKMLVNLGSLIARYFDEG